MEFLPDQPEMLNLYLRNNFELENLTWMLKKMKKENLVVHVDCRGEEEEESRGRWRRRRVRAMSGGGERDVKRRRVVVHSSDSETETPVHRTSAFYRLGANK